MNKKLTKEELTMLACSNAITSEEQVHQIKFKLKDINNEKK